MPESPQVKNSLLLFFCLAILAVVSLLTRSLIPVDETRYTTVAWEMWLRGDFLVPYLNGEPYSHKPPLLFWLIQLGWSVFGVNEWWPRLIPFFFSLGALLLVQQLGRRLWPRTDAWAMAPLITLGFTIWAFFSTAVMFDMMLTFFVLLAITGIHRIFTGHDNRWWLLLGVAWGLGVLSKGPVIFVHTLPLLILARYWMPSGVIVGWKPVMLGLLFALVIAAGLIFAWVIPATISGGEEYAQSLLFGQNVERALKAPNDALPWWYYIAFMPFILFPWAYWGGSWKALFSKQFDNAVVAVKSDKVVNAQRFCLAWALPVLLLFTMISGKKVHYLLPVLPAVALYLSSRLAHRKEPGSNREMWPLTAIYLAVAVLIGSLPFFFESYDLPYWIPGISVFSGIPFAALAIAGHLYVRGSQLNRVRFISLQTIIFLAIAHVILFIPASTGYDLKPVAAEIARLQDQDHHIAHNGKYRGEYHFLGRLAEPFDVVYDHTEQQWMAENTQGYVIGYRYEKCGEQQQPALYQRLFRNAQCLTIRTSAQQMEFLERRSRNKD